MSGIADKVGPHTFCKQCNRVIGKDIVQGGKCPDCASSGKSPGPAEAESRRKGILGMRPKEGDKD